MTTDTRPTCGVTLWDPHATGNGGHRRTWSCGQPLATDRLCAQHEADRVRLGGAA